MSRFRRWLAFVADVEFDFWGKAKTRTVMLWAGMASLSWGVSTWIERDSTFLGASYVLIRALMPAWAWTLLFVGHTVAMLTCRWWIGGAPRWLNIAACFYGFVIWGFYVVATDISLGLWYAPGTSSEVVMVFFLGWSLRRAGRLPGEGSNGDR